MRYTLVILKPDGTVAEDGPYATLRSAQSGKRNLQGYLDDHNKTGWQLRIKKS